MVAGRHPAILTAEQQAWVVSLIPVAEQEARLFNRPSWVKLAEMKAAAYWGLCLAAFYQDRPGTTLARLCCRQAISRDVSRLFFRVRSRRRIGRRVDSIDDVDQWIEDDPLETLIAREELELLRAAISRLPRAQRAAMARRLDGDGVDRSGTMRRGLKSLRLALRCGAARPYPSG